MVLTLIRVNLPEQRPKSCPRFARERPEQACFRQRNSLHCPDRVRGADGGFEHRAKRAFSSQVGAGQGCILLGVRGSCCQHGVPKGHESYVNSFIGAMLNVGSLGFVPGQYHGHNEIILNKF